MRRVYAPFEAGLQSPTGTVYRHEIPGGLLEPGDLILEIRPAGRSASPETER